MWCSKQNMESNKKKKNDWLLAGILLGAAFLSFAVLRIASAPGEQVVVMVNDALYASLPLRQDARLEITGEGGTNWLVVENGEAWVSQADCSNQICVNTGKISQVGEVIVCLPHKVVITIETGG